MIWERRFDYMGIRMPWDIYEIAILIDASIKVTSGECTRISAIRDISKKLRRKAVNAGLDIDDAFRDENSIDMQMNIIQRLMKDNSGSRKHVSQRFIYMVNLYMTDRKEFDETLAEAETMIGDDEISESEDLQQEKYLSFDSDDSDISSIKGDQSVYLTGGESVHIISDLEDIKDPGLYLPVGYSYKEKPMVKAESWKELYIRIMANLSSEHYDSLLSWAGMGDLYKTADDNPDSRVNLRGSLYLETDIADDRIIDKIIKYIHVCNEKTDAVKIAVKY